MQQPYVAVIEKSKEGYGVFFPDLPGCTSYGATVSEAARNAVLAAQSHVALAAEFGATLAPPTALEDVHIDEDIKVAAKVMVPVEIADKKERVNISLPRSVLAALDAMATLRGHDRSAMIIDLVRNASGVVAGRQINRR